MSKLVFQEIFDGNGGNSGGNGSENTNDPKYSTKKAKLTLEDGTMVLIDVVVASEGTIINQ